MIEEKYSKEESLMDVDEKGSQGREQYEGVEQNGIQTSEYVRALKTLPDEVFSTVPLNDDPTEPCETFRAYFLGSIVAIVGTGLNTWFGARQPGIYISPLVAQFVSHPMGVILAKSLPTKQFHLPFCGERLFSFNPGPWTVKEHTIVTLMATVSFPTATAIDIILATKLPVFFDDEALGGKLGFQFLTVLSTQFLGFSLAGLARDYLVYPSSMIWPLNLAKVALFNALHRRKVDEDGNCVLEKVEKGQPEPSVNGWRVSMYRFCLYAVIGSFVWFFFTGFITPFLAFFNWPTWPAPTNKRLAIIMGSISGLGLNPIPSFDWTFISASGLTPLITPWWATLQIFIGCLIGLVIIIAMYFSNTWYSAYMLPNSNGAFDRFGKAYDVSKVLNPDNTLNEEAYRQYSPIYYTAGYNVVFGAYFAQYTATLLHAVLNHGTELKIGFNAGFRQFKSFITRRKLEEEGYNSERRPGTDIHFDIMRGYGSVPQWWFLGITLIALVMGIVVVEVYNTTMPVWGIFCCLALAVVFLVPAGIILAVSNVQLTLVVLAEIIPGVAIPGRPYANMFFKIYGWVSLIQALLYAQDQKLAHYLHVPPRATFRAQMIGCLIGSFISLAVLNWQIAVVKDLCSPKQADLLTCPYYTTFFSSALLFGVVGPERAYGSHGLYKYLMFAFLVGAGLTFVFWIIRRIRPNKYTNSVNIPVVISGAQYFAPYNFAYVWSGVPLAFTFMRFIYRRYPAWWKKYCYVLSIGLTVGATISAIIQFFCISLPGGKFTWWGTTFYASGCDGIGCPLKELPEVGYFGPGPGQFA